MVGFILGIFVGTAAGIFIAALLAAANEHRYEKRNGG